MSDVPESPARSSAEPAARPAIANPLFWAWLALLGVHRLWLVLARADVFFYGEELEKGTAAKAMLDGIPLEHHRLAYHYYELGGFFVSHLKALAFALVGESIWAHKLVAILWCGALFAALWTLLARHFGERAAHWGAAFFVFAPGSIQKLSLLGLGIHFEAGLFLLVVLDLGLRVWSEGPSARRLFALGLASGLGISYSYQLVLAVGYVGLLLLATRPRVVFSSDGLAGTAGMLLGLGPFLWMLARVGGAIFDIHGANLGTGGSEDGPSLAERVTPFLRSVFEEGGAGSPAFAIAFCALSVAAVVFACLDPVARRARAARVLAGFGLFWTVVYASSDFVVGAVYHHFLWMRFAPLWLVSCVLLSAFAARGGRIGRAVAALLLVSGVVDTAGALREGTPGRPLEGYRVLSSLRGYDYEGYFAKIVGHIEGEGVARLAPLLAFDEPRRDWLRADLAAVALHEARSRGSGDTFAGELAALDSDGVRDFAAGLGAHTWELGGGSLEGLFEYAALYPAPTAKALVYGVGRWGRANPYLRTPLEGELAELPVDERLEPFLEGVGYRAFRRLVVGPFGGGATAVKPERVRARLEAQRPEFVPALVRGFEEALRMHSAR